MNLQEHKADTQQLVWDIVPPFDLRSNAGQVQVISVVVVPTFHSDSVGIENYPDWLKRVTKRIVFSTASDSTQLETQPGRWLSKDVADAGVSFFANASALLPSEPYIYASLDGHLVAEFRGGKGSLTVIISPEATVLFASTNHIVSEHVLERKKDRDGSKLRETLREIRNILAGNAAVDPSDR